MHLKIHGLPGQFYTKTYKQFVEILLNQSLQLNFISTSERNSYRKTLFARRTKTIEEAMEHFLKIVRFSKEKQNIFIKHIVNKYHSKDREFRSYYQNMDPKNRKLLKVYLDAQVYNLDEPYSFMEAIQKLHIPFPEDVELNCMEINFETFLHKEEEIEEKTEEETVEENIEVADTENYEEALLQCHQELQVIQPQIKQLFQKITTIEDISQKLLTKEPSIVQAANVSTIPESVSRDIRDIMQQQTEIKDQANEQQRFSLNVYKKIDDIEKTQQRIMNLLAQPQTQINNVIIEMQKQNSVMIRKIIRRFTFMYILTTILVLCVPYVHHLEKYWNMLAEYLIKYY